MRVGIFGGSFNPPHMGHINSLLTVHKKAGLEKIHVVPAAQNPLKMQVAGPTTEQRLELVKLALTSYGKQFVVDDQEIKRGGLSYTIDTVLNLRKEISAEDLFLIIGADQFEEFSQWKDYQKILTEANLIVTTRPGWDIPQEADELPEYLKALIAEYDFNFIELTTGRNVQFIRLQDVEISATEVRKLLRQGRPVDKVLPLAVENYIKENKLYRPIGEKVGDFEKFTEFCSRVLFDKKAIQVRGFDLTTLSAPTEYSLIASGTSTRHAVSLAENVVDAVKEEYNVLPLSVEGFEEGRWVLVDYGSLIVHVFYDFVRQEYSLEKLWKDGREMNLKDPSVN